MFIGIVAFGVLVGTVMGFAGAGGGIIAVPALVYVMGIPLGTAISTSLVMGSVAPLAALAPRLRSGGVDWKIMIAVVIAGIPSTFAGTAVGALLPNDVVLVLFSILMVGAGIQMIRAKPNRVDVGPRPRTWIVRALFVGLLVGFLTGLLGVGGGFIIVPALVFALDLPIKRAIGTSLAISVVNSLAGIVAHVGTTRPDWPVALAFAVPAMIASLVSARLATRVSSRVLQRSFAILIFVIAAVVSGAVAGVFLTWRWICGAAVRPLANGRGQSSRPRMARCCSSR